MKAPDCTRLIGLWLVAVLTVGCAYSPPLPMISMKWRSTRRREVNRDGWKPTLAGTAVAWRRLRTRSLARGWLCVPARHREPAGWFAIAATGLRRRGFDVYCLDRRGSGLNRENREYVSGHVDDYETLLADIDAFIQGLRGRHDQVFLVGLSWGGKLALAYGLSHPTAIDGLVLITPGLSAKVDVSGLEKLKIALLTSIKPTARVHVPSSLRCLRRRRSTSTTSAMIHYA